MTETLTIRLPSVQRKALRARAAATGRTESDIVRELIASQMQHRGSLGQRVGRHFGRLDFPTAPKDRDSWSSSIHRNNVRL